MFTLRDILDNVYNTLEINKSYTENEILDLINSYDNNYKPAYKKLAIQKCIVNNPARTNIGNIKDIFYIKNDLLYKYVDSIDISKYYFNSERSKENNIKNTKIRSDKIAKFLETYKKYYLKVSHYKKPESDICIIVNCCKNKKLDKSLLPAYLRYCGRETTLITDLKTIYNKKIDVYIISAQYGLIPYDEKIEYYNQTFNNLDIYALKQIVPELHIREDIDKIFNEYKYNFLCLSNKYLATLDLRHPFMTENNIISFALEKNKDTYNEILAKNKFIIDFQKDYLKYFKKYNGICIKGGIINEVFLKYKDYEFKDNLNLINDLILDFKNKYDQPKQFNLLNYMKKGDM